MPKFKAEDYKDLATTMSGSVSLSGHYDLGTAENLTIWYVNGDLKTSGNVTFSGYGIFLVKEKIEIKHDVSMADDDSMIGLYTGKEFKMHKNDIATLRGLIISNEAVKIEGDLFLTGSMTAGKKVEVKKDGSLTIRYRRADPLLTNSIWPMN